ncbi:umecyanin-like [Corylus avellana]|uniref:umecyanin-like n=1 Tax=Corylus avellana TaxID=13451 RepID=UPI001E1FB312|nr:umecyanin-like [Corylus avellana]
MGSRTGLIGWFGIVVAAIILLRGATAATVYEVGDSVGWTVPPNTSFYSTWASTKTFFLGDKLSFNWTTGTHTVAEVSKDEYDSCTKVSSYIGSPVIFTPPSTGSYYFICTVDDHCTRGQKLAFTVVSTPTVGSPPAESPTFSSASSLSVGALFAVLSTSVIYLFLGF